MWYSLSYGSGLYLCICLCYSFDMGIRKESGVLEYSFLFEGINGVQFRGVCYVFCGSFFGVVFQYWNIDL